MSTATSYPLTRGRTLILASLLVLAALAWGLLLWQGLTIMSRGRRGDACRALGQPDQHSARGSSAAGKASSSTPISRRSAW